MRETGRVARGKESANRKTDWTRIWLTMDATEHLLVARLVKRTHDACALAGAPLTAQEIVRDAVEAVQLGHAQSLLTERSADTGERRCYLQYVSPPLATTVAKRASNARNQRKRQHRITYRKQKQT